MLHILFHSIGFNPFTPKVAHIKWCAVCI